MSGRTRYLPANAESIEQAAGVLAADGLVAFPTETVYGLGARADHSKAVRRIFEAKGRPSFNPLIVHVRDMEHAASLSEAFPDTARRLAEAFWPGPLTLVVRRRPNAIVSEVTAGNETVALRMPAHPVALSLLRACDFCIAAPSANRSASISPTSAAHVMKSLGGRIDMVLDGGRTGFGIESTIVDITCNPVKLLRQGALSQLELAKYADVVDASGKALKEGDLLSAPGMMEKHYSPDAILIVLPANAIINEIEKRLSQNEKIGILAYSNALKWPEVHRIEMLCGEAPLYAAELYAALHRLDDAGSEVIVVEDVPFGLEWAAVRDRLRRASAKGL